MIELSNGYKLEYLASSGALGYDGRGYWWEQPLRWIKLLDINKFTPITKTITYSPREGNCFLKYSCIRIVNNGILNAMGLGNPGIDWWIKSHDNFTGIVSIYPENDYTFRRILKRLKKTNIIGIELNVSCPNIKKDNCLYEDLDELENILKIANDSFNFPIILKLGISSNIENLFPRIEKYIEAISINSVPWDIVYPDIKSPFEKFGGGALSGKIIQPYTWNYIKELKEITDIPIIGCSIWEYDDIKKLYDLGVSAISFGSIFLRYPWKPTQFVRRLEDENRNHL